jgi:hypothetical protein
MNISYFSAELMLPTTADRFIGLLPVLCALTTTLICRSHGAGGAAGGWRSKQGAQAGVLEA